MSDAARAQAQRFVAALRAALGEGLVGVYLHGSLAMGCYNPVCSDLDLLVATRERLTGAQRRVVSALLLAESGQPAPIEISLLAREQLWPWRYPTPFDLHYSETWRERTAQGLATGRVEAAADEPAPCDADLAAHITVLHARGSCLWGAPIAEAFPPVPRADYLDSVRADLEWGLALLAENPAYPVLNLCRTLAYLRTGAVHSKAEGGAWALAQLDSALRAPVRAALATYAAAEAGAPWPPAAELAVWAQAMFALLRQEDVARTHFIEA